MSDYSVFCMQQYIFLLSGEHPALAQAELAARNPLATLVEVADRFVVVSSEEVICSSLAFTKRVFRVFAQGSPVKIADFLSTEHLEVSGSVRFDRYALDESILIATDELHRMLFSWLGSPVIDLRSPSRRFAVLCAKNAWFVAEQVWVNDEDFSSRKNQLRPCPHPTSLHPKLARCMVNLARPVNSLLDPFCGSGGLLLESCLLGLATTGVDIDKSMLLRARKNLSFFGCKAVLVHGDACKYASSASVVVTDLPYGRNSKASELKPLFGAFFLHAKGITRRMVVAYPCVVDAASLAQEAGWVVRNRFSWSLHRSLQKVIVVLDLAE